MKKDLQVNALYFIDCIDEKEPKSTNALSLYNDTVNKMKIIDNNIDTEYFTIETKKDFLNTLSLINEKEIQNKNVLIHIYLHGSKNLDGLVANDKILISWVEIQEKTRDINIKTRNGLFLILALCHGKYIGEKINIKLKSPFNKLIASNYEEYVDDIYNLFHKFYSNLIFDNNVIRAFEEAQTEKDKFYFKDTYTVVSDAFSSIIKKRETDLPLLYKEFLNTENAPKITFEEYDNLIKMTYPEILNNMENEFYIK